MQYSDLLRYIADSDKTANRWKNLDAKAILFWYRQSPRPLEVPLSSRGASVAVDNPSLQFSGEVLVWLDTEGHLVSLRAVPPQVQQSAGTAPAPDWTVFFAAAGLDISQWKPADAQWSPLSFVDTRAAWQGALPNRPGTPVRIEAAAFQGKPVSFDILGPWARATQMEPYQLRTGERVANMIYVLLAAALIGGGIFFTRRNLRLGRGDRRNATRLAFIVMGMGMLAAALKTHHVPVLKVLNWFITYAGSSLFWACLLWVLYIAIEPFVRRRWPQILVSWTRLLSGD